MLLQLLLILLQSGYRLGELESLSIAMYLFNLFGIYLCFDVPVCGICMILNQVEYISEHYETNLDQFGDTLKLPGPKLHSHGSLLGSRGRFGGQQSTRQHCEATKHLYL